MSISIINRPTLNHIKGLQKCMDQETHSLRMYASAFTASGHKEVAKFFFGAAALIQQAKYKIDEGILLASAEDPQSD